MPTYVILDTESSGLAPPISACEIAWIHVDEQLNVLDAQCHRTDPQQPINPGATEVHGITNEMVAGLPSNAAICEKIPQPFAWVGHNASYDQRVIAQHVHYNAQLCTLALARRWLKQTTNHKLATLKTELGLSDQASHTALGDCYTTLDLLRHLCGVTGRSMPELIELESKPKMLTHMPFGMHKGVSFDKIPEGYLNWMRKQPDWHKDVIYTLNRLEALSCN